MNDIYCIEMQTVDLSPLLEEGKLSRFGEFLLDDLDDEDFVKRNHYACRALQCAVSGTGSSRQFTSNSVAMTKQQLQSFVDLLAESFFDDFDNATGHFGKKFLEEEFLERLSEFNRYGRDLQLILDTWDH